jgi:pimeloyl-ACP methyl ester carboxylesterase
MTDTPRFPAEDGAMLAYCDQGEGLPLLCLPGLTRSMADFDYLAPHLPPLRLIRMDYRGRGKSDWTAPPPILSSRKRRMPWRSSITSASRGPRSLAPRAGG